MTRHPPREILKGETLASTLLRAQNPDGGWGYTAGSVSWTEPTSYALLALTPSDHAAVDRGIRWLRSMQRSDGGWPPAAAVDHSTWVTAVAILALARAGKLENEDRSVRWLLDQTGRESQWIVRLRHFLLGVRPDHSGEDSGWPWFPGAAAWVVPTALGVLALKYLQRLGNRSGHGRIIEGQQFLLSRMCSDGGWNHGSSRALGYEAESYPETTGTALLALSGANDRRLQSSLERGRKHFDVCQSIYAASWLQLGLLAHGESVAALEKRMGERLGPPRDVQDLALALLAERAKEGTNVFLQ